MACNLSYFTATNKHNVNNSAFDMLFTEWLSSLNKTFYEMQSLNKW